MWQGFPIRPDQASTIARGVDHLYYFLTAVDLFFTALIFLTIFYLAIKYRRRSAETKATQVEGNLPLEVIWTIIPLGICAVTFLWGSSLFIRNSRPPEASTEIFVVGKQWMWKLQHPEGPMEINELHVPVRRPIKLTMTSEDVIHNFYVPAFRVQKDVVPGMYTSIWFEATSTGRYHFFCNQYCGTNHAVMGGYVIVMSPDDYEQWLSGGIRGRVDGLRGRQTLRTTGLHHLPWDRQGTTVCQPLWQPGQTHRRDHRDGRRSLHPGVDTLPLGENRGWISAPHADL